MTQTIAAELVSEFKSKGLSTLLGEYRRVGDATEALQKQLTGPLEDAYIHAFRRARAEMGLAADEMRRTLGHAVTTLGTDLGDLSKRGVRAFDDLRGGVRLLDDTLGSTHRSKNTFFTSLTTQAATAQRDLQRIHGDVRTLGTLLSGLHMPTLKMPSFGGGGGGGFGLPNPFGIVGGAVGGVLGAGANLAGGALSLAAGGAQAAAGYGLDVLGQAAGIDKSRAQLYAVMGGKGTGPGEVSPAMQKQLTDAAFALSRDPSTGVVDPMQAFEAMIEAAKAGTTDPKQMQTDALTALQMRAAGGGKMDTGAAMRLLITGKNAFGRFHYSDKDIANILVGGANASTLDIGQFQNMISGGGAAAAASGMDLQQFVQWGSLLANAGVSPGQIGGGIKQAIRMADPRSKTAKAAMEQLGLLQTHTVTVGATAGTAAGQEWVAGHYEDRPMSGGSGGGTTYLNGNKLGPAKAAGGATSIQYHQVWVGGHYKQTAATKGKQGKEQTVVDSNGLFDAQGEIVDPGAFFKKLAAGTAGMNDEQISKLIGDAFNPKAAAYIQPLLNMYKNDPTVFAHMSDAMKQQGDVVKTQASAVDNLSDSWRNFLNTAQAIPQRMLLDATPALTTLTNMGTTLLNDITGGDWAKVKVDLAADIQQIGGVLKTEIPKLLDGAKTGTLDIVATLFGLDAADNVRQFLDVDIPRMWNGASSAFQGLTNFWDKDLKPLLFGTDAERAAVMGKLAGAIGGVVSGAIAGSIQGPGAADVGTAVAAFWGDLGTILGHGDPKTMDAIKTSLHTEWGKTVAGGLATDDDAVGHAMDDLAAKVRNALGTALAGLPGFLAGKIKEAWDATPKQVQDLMNFLNGRPTGSGPAAGTIPAYDAAQHAPGTPGNPIKTPAGGIAGVPLVYGPFKPVAATPPPSLADAHAARLQGRARGGPVMAGQTYLVGEHQAELFTPTTNGRILPSVDGGGVHFHGDIIVPITVPGGPGVWERLPITAGQVVAREIQRRIDLGTARS